MFFLITLIRNLLYDLKILRSYSFDLPIITVGNITVGGTGKTPHIEYFIRKYLGQGKRVAVLSRGYKRKTKGMVIADGTATADSIGDEPYQIFRKFPNITLVVDKDRINAVEYLLAQPSKPDVILLDDGFQYRRLAAGHQIVLVDFNRPIFSDCIMPYGRLRESRRGIKRANEVIVTKCPPDMSETDKCRWAEQLKLRQGTVLGFSTFEFFPPRNIFDSVPLDISQTYDVHVVTGVVNADTLYNYINPFCRTIAKTTYPDHHHFSESDIDKINRLADRDTIIIVTEKDAARLLGASTLTPKAKNSIYSVEVRVKFL